MLSLIKYVESSNRIKINILLIAVKKKDLNNQKRCSRFELVYDPSEKLAKFGQILSQNKNRSQKKKKKKSIMTFTSMSR